MNIMPSGTSLGADGDEHPNQADEALRRARERDQRGGTR